VQLVIAWTIAQPGVTAAIVGARDAAQIHENLQAQKVHLTKDELSLIAEQLKSLELVSAV